MAGLSGLPYFIQYQGELQNQALQRQQAQQQLMEFQQQQQDRQRQQAALAAAGNALPQLIAPPQQPAPQPPFPGQASQPAPQQPQGGVPLPQGPVPGLRPPIPPGGVQGAMPPAGVPPFRPMPTTPPASAAPQGAIPAPPAPPAVAAPQQPQGGPLTMQSAIKVLQDQGLSGADLMAGLQQLTPLLDAQSRQQAAQAQQQFQHELQISQLEERAREADQRSRDTEASIEERRAAANAADQSRMLIAQLVASTRRDVAGIGAPGAGAPPSGTSAPTTDGLPAPVGGGGLSGDAVRNLSTRLKAGDAAALTGLSRPARAAVQNDLAKIDKGGGADIAGNQIDFAAARRGAQAATQREANIATSEKAITNPGGLADQVLDAARKTYRTGSPFLNQKINYVLANYQGDPAVVDLKNALGDLEGQFDKAMAGGGAATDAVRTEVHQRINDAQTIPQLEAAINRMKLGLRKEGEAAQETSKMFADRVRQAGKTGTSTAAPSGGGGETKTIGNKTYVKRGNDWYEQ